MLSDPFRWIGLWRKFVETQQMGHASRPEPKIKIEVAAPKMAHMEVQTQDSPEGFEPDPAADNPRFR